MVVSLLVAALVALVAARLVSWLRGGRARGDDTERVERWFTDHLMRMPRVRGAVGAFDRRVWGGATGLIALAALIGVGIVVGSLAVAVTRSGFADLDSSVAEWGSERATPWSSDVLRAITVLGDGWVMVPVVIVVAAITQWQRARWAAIAYAVFVSLGVSLVNNTLKWIVDRDRPEVEHLVESGGSSFPSGHSATAAATWAAIAFMPALIVEVLDVGAEGFGDA